MFFNAKISVVIGDKAVQTVVAVDTKNESSEIGSDCSIIVPINCRIQYVNGKRDYLTDYPKNLFKVGDSVTIKAWYEGYDTVEVFTGFVADFMEGTPLEIRCMDYSYWMNQGTFGSKRVLLKKNRKSTGTHESVGSSFKSITLQNLLQQLIDFTNNTIDATAENANHIELLLPVPDLTLVDLTFALMSPAAILAWVKKTIGLNISLQGTQLYCNVASNTLRTIKYRTDRNVLSSDLQKPHSLFQSYKVKAWFIRQDGTRDSFEVGDSNGTMREVFFYRVQRDTVLYRKLAEEALKKIKQEKYNGSIETLLYPDCKLFDQINYIDIRYPDRSGNYVVTGIGFSLTENGYRRKQKLSFLSEIQ
jgi:hypothetical protein